MFLVSACANILLLANCSTRQQGNKTRVELSQGSPNTRQVKGTYQAWDQGGGKEDQGGGKLTPLLTTALRAPNGG